MESSVQGVSGSVSGKEAITQINVIIDKQNSHKIPFPPVGYCRHARLEQLTKPEIAALSQFNFSFYTVLLELSDPLWKDDFKKANNEAKGLKIPMQVILSFSSSVDSELSSFIEICNFIFPFVEEVIILQAEHKITPDGLLQKILPSLREGLHHVKVGIGSLEDINEIVNARPAMNDADFLSVPFILTEKDTVNTLRQLDLVHTLKSGSHGKDIYLNPLNFKAGLKEYSLDPEGSWSTEQQKKDSIYNSGKLISIFKSLVFSGAGAISIYENDEKSPIFKVDYSNVNLEKIASFPEYFMLKQVLEMHNGFIIQTNTSAPGSLDAFVFTAGGKTKVILINLSSAELSVSLSGISAHASYITFDAVTLLPILSQPGLKPEEYSKPVECSHNHADFHIAPYGMVIVHE